MASASFSYRSAIGVAVIAALTIAACDCGGRTTQRQLLAERPVQPVVQQQVPLPQPAELLGQLAAPRTASYQETDLIREGKQYEQSLPQQRAAVAGDSVEFTADWSAASGLEPENLAFGIFSFEAAGYDRAAEVHYGWEQPPTDIGTAWLGLANWDTDSWAWFPCTAAGVTALPDFGPYISDTDVLLVAVVQANADTSALRWIRLGPLQLTAKLSATPDRGLAPMDVYLSSAGSSTAVGTIDEHEWDFDGDGEFDDSSGLNPAVNKTYPISGHWTAAVRLTTSYGVTAVAETEISGDGSWTHTWGQGDSCEIEGLACDGQDAVYEIGSLRTSDKQQQVLLLKYGLDGDLQWARTWGGTHDDVGSGVVCAADGAIYTSGTTGDSIHSSQDVLVQRWDSSGNVAWSRVWELPSNQQGVGLGVGGDRVGVLAHAQEDVLVLCFGTDGVFDWASNVGGTNVDTGNDIAVTRNPTTDEVAIHIAGTSRSFAPGGGLYREAMYIGYSADGELTAFSTWTCDNNTQANGIYAKRNLISQEIYIVGDIDSGTGGSTQGLLLEYGGGDLLSESWGWEDPPYERAVAVDKRGNDIFVAGEVSIGSGNASAVLQFDTSGTLQAAEAWDTDTPSSFTCLALYPDSGVLAGGTAESRSAGLWTAVLEGIDLVFGDWVSHTGSVDVSTPVGTVQSPALFADAEPDGVLDIGSGAPGGDSLVLTYAFP